MKKRICALAVACAAVVALPAIASAGKDDEPTLSELAERILQLEQRLQEMEEEHATEVDALREDYERELESLRRQVEAGAEDELEQLRREAEEATAEEEKREDEAAAAREKPTGRQRALQALNPEISFLGDVSYDWTDTEVQDQFLLRGAEISFQSVLDPYTRFKATLAGHQEPPGLEEHHEGEGEEEEEHGHGDEINVSIEEAYMEWVALPLNSRLRVGKFRQQFGTLNRWHPHALPSTDVPFALQNIFGHEGLVGLGVGLDVTLPSLWADSNSLTVELVNADNGSAFAGSEFDDPALLLRHGGFFDLGDAAYFEASLNGMIGPNDSHGSDTTLGSLDFNFVWEPVQQARYRGVELRGEYIWTRFDEEEGGTIESQSLYAYLTWKFARRWIVGVRYDDAELPCDRFELLHEQEFREGLREVAVTPFLTFWQSEFVRLRLQYQHAERDFAFHRGPDGDDRLWLQVTFAAGPHKHEAY